MTHHVVEQLLTRSNRLGSFSAQRAPLEREVAPSIDSHTTGLLDPVDAGVAAAFLR